MSTDQLFTWRRLARKGRLGGDAGPAAFAEAVIVDREAAAAALPTPAGACRRMEIVLADGLRVIVEQGVDANALGAPNRRARTAMTIPIPSGARVWLATGRTAQGIRWACAPGPGDPQA